MITTEHVQQSIEKALKGESNLTQEELSVRGFSTFTIRSLFNSLCNIEGTYLEVGLFCGATFVSSFNKNLISIGIENHAQDFSEGFEKVKKELADNLEKFSHRSKEVKVFYEDCFAIDKDKLPNNIDVFFFDGFHSFETQRDALPYFLDNMSNKFAFLVDDFSWGYVKDGTDAGLALLSDKIEIEKCWVLRGYNLENDPIWHNSVAIYLINKK